MWASHLEEVERLQATIAALRNEVVALKREQADGAVKLTSHAGVLAEKDASIAKNAREVEILRQQLDAKREDNMRLQKQLTRLVDEVRQSQNDATVAQQERERKLGPLTAQAEALGHSVAVKQRQVDLMQRDLDATNQQNVSLQADLASMRQLVEQGEKRQQELQAALESQAEAYRRRERLLHARCRLLQAWCFRAWWCQEAELDPAQVEAGTTPDALASEGRLATAARGSNAAVDIVPRKRHPMPADWRAVLRFQATLFHWLAAETIRGKTSELRGNLPLEEQVTAAAGVNAGISRSEPPETLRIPA